jgi:hypothetical protein
MLARDIVNEMVKELEALQSQRAAQGWDKFWRDCMRFALPQDVSYDQLLQGGSIGAVTSTIRTTTAQRTTDLYDQTSLWAIERLTAGLLSLKTPESARWHNLTIDDPFGHEETNEEEASLDRLSNYLFKVRANPRSGFWPTHKAAVRSVCAMGNGFFFLEELYGDAKLPFRYEFVPLGECYAVVDMSGQLIRFYRARRLSAEQIVRRWPETASAKHKQWAADPDKRHQTLPVAHAVIPRDPEMRKRGIGVTAAPMIGAYIDLEDNVLLGETGYYEMPYIGHSWNAIAGRAYSEGPMALALAEVKSLNEMAKNELISSQQAVRPPLATMSENMQRIRLNAGAVNPGLINGDGRLMVQPIMTHTRPDFATQVLESRRNNVRELLYLNLWQILIQSPDMTATEALLRSQEKGDLLGPVGISFNYSLSTMVDREIAILNRKGAFAEGSPLEMPESMDDADVAPHFTAPLDRMRSLEEVTGAQQTVAAMVEVAALKPEILDRLDVDAYAELLRKGHGAPARLFLPEEKVSERRDESNQQEQLANTLGLLQQGGQAAQGIGQGVQAVAGAMPSGGPMPDAAGAVAA